MTEAFQHATKMLADGSDPVAVLNELRERGVRSVDAFWFLMGHLAFEDVKRSMSKSRYLPQAEPRKPRPGGLGPDTQVVADAIRVAYAQGVPEGDIRPLLRILGAHYGFRSVAAIAEEAGVMEYYRAYTTVMGAFVEPIAEEHLRRVARRLLREGD